MQKSRHREQQLKKAFRKLKAARERDDRFFQRYYLSPDDMDFWDDSVSDILACKILYLYLVRMFDKKGVAICPHTFRTELPVLETEFVSGDMNDAIFEYLGNSFPLADEILRLMRIFGWHYEEYDNHEINQEFYDPKDFTKPIWDFLSPYFKSIKEDIQESDGYLNLGILTNRRYGAFLKFVEKYPDELPAWLTEEISTLICHVANPMAFYLTDFADEMLTEDGTFVSCFAFGFCGGWECYCEKYVIHPTAALYAYYVEQYMQLACRFNRCLRNYMRRHTV